MKTKEQKRSEATERAKQVYKMREGQYFRDKFPDEISYVKQFMTREQSTELLTKIE